MLAMLSPLIIVHVVSPVTVEHPAVVAAAPIDDPDVMLTEAHENQFVVATNKVHPSAGQDKPLGTVKVI